MMVNILTIFIFSKLDKTLTNMSHPYRYVSTGGAYFRLLLGCVLTVSCILAGEVEHLLKKAESGDPQAQYDLAQLYGNGSKEIPRNQEAAFSWFMKAGEQGLAPAQYQVGRLLFYGQGVARNQQEAVNWYYVAAEQGHMEAQFELGKCYVLGKGIQRDHGEALRWYRLAADQGMQQAQFAVARLYQKGNPEVRDAGKAFGFYLKSAHQGDSYSQFLVGTFYENGDGVAQNFTEAIKWYEKAAKQDSAPARCRLGVLYKEGKGVPPDPISAYAWFSMGKFALSGDKTAKSAYDELKSQMTPEQLEEVQQRAASLRKSHPIEVEESE